MVAAFAAVSFQFHFAHAKYITSKYIVNQVPLNVCRL